LFTHDNGKMVAFADGSVDAPFHREATMDDVRRRLFALIDATPNLDWLLLTKRPENIKSMWWGDLVTGFRPKSRENVWIGTSVENQEYANKRIPELLKCRDLSPVLFLSCEPLLGPVDLSQIPIHGYNLPHLDVLRGGSWTGSPWGFVNSHNAPRIDWVITGGESGPNARPSHPDWFRSLRDQCSAAGVAFHHKQGGEWGPIETANPVQENNAMYHVCDGGERLYRVGKKAAGRLLDGVEHNEFPTLQ